MGQDGGDRRVSGESLPDGASRSVPDSWVLHPRKQTGHLHRARDAAPKNGERRRCGGPHAAQSRRCPAGAWPRQGRSPRRPFLALLTVPLDCQLLMFSNLLRSDTPCQPLPHSLRLAGVPGLPHCFSGIGPRNTPSMSPCADHPQQVRRVVFEGEALCRTCVREGRSAQGVVAVQTTLKAAVEATCGPRPSSRGTRNEYASADAAEVGAVGRRRPDRGTGVR